MQCYLILWGSSLIGVPLHPIIIIKSAFYRETNNRTGHEGVDFYHLFFNFVNLTTCICMIIGQVQDKIKGGASA